MNKAQIFDLIEDNGCLHCQIFDTSDNKLFSIEGMQTPQELVNKLENVLDHFKEYKRIKIKCKENAKTSSNNGFCWYMEFPKSEEEKKTVATAGPSQSIGAMELVTLITGMQSKIFDAQLATITANNANKENDPSKWIPVLQAFAPSLGLTVAQPSTIQGPPTNLVYKDVRNATLTDDQKNALITDNLFKINNSIGSERMLTLSCLLNDNKDLKNNIDKILKLLNAVNIDPSLLDKAMMFI